MLALVPSFVHHKVMRIQLLHGLYAEIDDEDAVLASYGWTATKKPKAQTYYAYAKINGKKTALHRVVMGALPGDEIDHKNGNGLDCRKENLRRVTHQENMMNRPMPRSNTSGVKGVRERKGGIWAGKVTCRGVRYEFTKKDRAAVEAWVIAKREELHGDFARHR